MDNLRTISAITWHLECMALATTAIDSFRPPADAFQMRINYSLYITNLMSAIDMFEEEYGDPFKDELENSLKTSDFSGAHILGYMRELRNSIVHRGVDPASCGTVIGGRVLALSPITVQNRKGSNVYTAPDRLLRDIYIHCEIAAKPIFERFLEPCLKAILSTTPEAMLEAYLAALDDIPHMPDWAKNMASDNTTPDMLGMAQSHQVEKLRAILKPQIDGRIV